MKLSSWIHGSIITACAMLAAHGAHAQQAAATSTSPPPQGSTGDLDEVVIHGIKRGELILPTTVTSNSAYGLDLGVMDVPRNTTVISQAQLAALNIQNPGGFSYLTSSSYADASFGQPNIPRIRGQYGDLFFNGMRDSFTLNGYGAPISFNNVDSIDIIKGPASVQAGPGPGVGGAIDITTKMPSLTKATANFSLEADSQQKRIATADVTGPLSSNTAARLTVTSNDSGSYYYDMFFHQQSVYAALLTQFTPAYSVLFWADYVDTKYRENDGVNRVNQDLIDNGTYLTGAPDPSTISGFGTEVNLSGATVQLNPRIIIDEPPGTGAHAQHIKVQIVQTYRASDSFSIVNNTFYDYLNRYNQIEAYYADTTRGSYTVENKTDLTLKFGTGAVSHAIDGGFTFRFAHVDDVQNYINEPVSVYDLSGDPNSWIFPAALQIPSGAYAYLAAFDHPQYGAPGRNAFFLNGSVIQNLQDGAIFFEDRMVFSPQWSALLGVREDLVQLNYADPLGGPICTECGTTLPQSASTAWYGLRNGNLSVVYSPTPHISAYLTYNNAQYSLPTANDGAIATWGEAPSQQLQLDTTLYEAGLKFDLLDKALFISNAVFSQTRNIPIGVGLSNSVAHIKGFETELNFQPNPRFFATASYSFVHTILDTASGFYNFPEVAGLNIDGAGTTAVFQGNSFIDPGVPQHLFNVLVNYKDPSGFGAQANLQVTGPIDVTQRGYINIAATNAAFNNDLGFLGLTQPLVGPGGIVPLSVVGANGYYNPPQIPWQFTLNAAAFYSFDHYTVKFSIYNLTSQHNLINDIPFYGNDFLTRVPPRSYDLTFSARF